MSPVKVVLLHKINYRVKMYKSALLFSFLLFCQNTQSKPIESDTLSKPHVILDEVVITSYKEKKNIREIPASVSYVPLSEIQNKNIVSMKDISSYIPNLFIPDYGSKLTSPVYIRGIGSKINAPSVGLYVDGVPFFEKSVFDLDINEVDRIEVLRGPQGTLYGRNTMGGMINIYTKNPLVYEGGTLSATMANYGQAQLSGAYYGKVNDSFGYSLSGNYKHSDGFFKNDYTGNEADNLDAASGKLKLYWKMNSRFNANLLVNYEYSDQGGYPYGLMDMTTGKIGNVNYNEYSSYRRGVLTSGLTLNYSFDNFLLKSVTGYQYSDDRQAIDQDFTPKPLYFVTQTQRQHMISQELEMRSAGDHRYTWLNGFFAFHQSSVSSVNVSPTLKDYDSPTDGFAFYHQSTLKDLIFEKLSATVGLRFDYEKARQDYNYVKVVSGVTQPVLALNTKLDFTQLTPKFSLQYQFTPFNMTYATVTRGYKTGGFNTSFDTEINQTFKPEYSWNYEVGTKFFCFGDRLKGDFSLFYIDWRNQQISQPLLSGKGSLLKNAGKSYSKGVELSMQGEVTKALNLQMSYGFTEAKFREYAGEANSYNAGFNYSGNYIPYVPRQTVMLGGDYTLNLCSNFIDRLVFSAQYVGTGKLYWNDKNMVNQSYYGLLNGKVSARKGNLMVDLWIKNATSQDYTAFYLESLGNSFGQKGKPMTFGATISFTL